MAGADNTAAVDVQFHQEIIQSQMYAEQESEFVAMLAVIKVFSLDILHRQPSARFAHVSM